MASHERGPDGERTGRRRQSYLILVRLDILCESPPGMMDPRGEATWPIGTAGVKCSWPKGRPDRSGDAVRDLFHQPIGPEFPEFRP
jgi:hypothetical protein